MGRGLSPPFSSLSGHQRCERGKRSSMSDSEEYDSSDEEPEVSLGENTPPQGDPAGEFDSSDEEQLDQQEEGDLSADVALGSRDPGQAGQPRSPSEPLSDTEPDHILEEEEPDLLLEERPGFEKEEGSPVVGGFDEPVESPLDTEERDIEAVSDTAEDESHLGADATPVEITSSDFQGAEASTSYEEELQPGNVQDEDDATTASGAIVPEPETTKLLEEEGDYEPAMADIRETSPAEGGGEMAAQVGKKARKFLEDSDSEQEELGNAPGASSSGEAAAAQSSFSAGMEDVFGDDSEEDEPVVLKRKRGAASGVPKDEEEEEGGASDGSGEEEGSPMVKRKRTDSAVSSGEEGEDDVAELQDEVAELEGGEGAFGAEEEERGGVGTKDGSDDEPEEEPKELGPSDWDVMMARRKEAMSRARKRKQKNVDITWNDDHIMAMIGQMKETAEEDRQLNLARKAATKKLQLLPTVLAHLKKSDLQSAFIECGILSALAEWLTPLPDHSLPHMRIRESILDTLRTYPVLDSTLLKSSKIGKAVMLIYRHPKETRKNKEKAGKLINDWARPIFGLASDFKSLTRDEREKRDYAHLSQAARRRMSSGERSGAMEDEEGPQKPGDKGWVGRARVPMPSNRDYVVRPKWNVEQEFKKGPSKKVLNRYEKQLQKKKMRQQLTKSTHAVGISVEGRKMPL